MFCANWVRDVSEDAQHAFPGHGQMKPQQGCNLHSLLAAADTAMYEAKRNGRNRYAYAVTLTN